MAQHDYVIANGSGATVRADINSALAAIASTNKGPSAPPAPTAGMIWVDDNTPSTTVWTMFVYDGAAWIRIGLIDTSTDTFAILPDTWTDLASAATTDLGGTNAANLRITGTTTITSFGTAPSGARRQLRFAASLTLTHNGSSLILPGARNIVTAADDTAVAVSLGSGNWIVTGYTRQPSQAAAEAATTSGSAVAFTGIPAGVQWLELGLFGVRTAAAAQVLCELGHGGGPTYVTTGYSGAITLVENAVTPSGGLLTVGFALGSITAPRIGRLSLRRRNPSSNDWLAHGLIAPEGASATVQVVGSVSLPAELTALRLTTSSSFNLGAANLAWGF